MTDRIAPECGCTTPGKIVRGMCQVHYDRWVHATPKAERGRPPRFSRTFEDFVDKTHRNGCWLWTGNINRGGYGLWSDIANTGAQGLAHRLALASVEKPEDESLFACHHCDTRRCVNPKHLYWGTAADNAADMVARTGVHNKGHVTTHCPRGHEIVGENSRTLIVKGTTRHTCRTCDNERVKRYAAKARVGNRVRDKVSDYIAQSGKELVTVTRATELTGLSRSAIDRRIRAGIITTYRLSWTRMWVDAEELRQIGLVS